MLIPHKPLTFSRAALQEVDRRAVEEYHLPILVLMENAGRAAAELAHEVTGRKGPILVVCGPGNNGADGLVAARHLANWGHPMHILLAAGRAGTQNGPSVDVPPTPHATQLSIIQAMRLPVQSISADHSEIRDYLVEAPADGLIIDALFGTGLSRAPTGLNLDIIRALNGARHPVLAIDIPSGLDADTGQPLEGDSASAIVANYTLSLVGLKLGYRSLMAGKYVGKVTTADIGIPLELLRALAS